MKTNQTLEELEELKRQLMDNLEAIDKIIQLLRDRKPLIADINEKPKMVKKPTESMHERVISAVLNLIDERGQVTNSQILGYLEDKHIKLGKNKDKEATLGAILWTERKRNNARIRRIRRGLWDKKYEKRQKLPVINVKPIQLPPFGKDIFKIPGEEKKA